VAAGKIWSEGERFYRGETEITELSEQDRRLLRHFLNMPLAVRSLDQLKDAAWLEDNPQGISSEAIQQAIRHLRTSIELDPSQPRYLLTVPKAGYRFFPDGAPVITSFNA
jgi:DNA-binding response OmpR family regulator